MRLLLLLALVACTREEPPSKTQPEPVARPAVRPTPFVPPVPTVQTKPRSINYMVGGLGSWRGNVCGCMWRVDVDFATRVVIATDPDNKPWTRKLSPGEVDDFYAMAADAITEPKIKQSEATDAMEEIVMTFDDTHDFRVSNSGQIQRPAAAKLAVALNTAAHWKKVD